MEKHEVKNLVFPVPVLGFAAYSGIGKTTLLVKLLPLMKLQGLRVAMIKHTHHDFDIDTPGKDSYELRKAGANQVLVASDRRTVLMRENDHFADPDLPGLVNKLELDNVDLVMVEGFRHVPFPKIELHRPSTGKELIYTNDKSVVAIASDTDIETGGLPLLNLNAAEEVAGFINRWMHNQGVNHVK